MADGAGEGVGLGTADRSASPGDCSKKVAGGALIRQGCLMCLWEIAACGSP
jgi:hypothetical protein